MWKKLNKLEQKYLNNYDIDILKDKIEDIYKLYPLDAKTASKSNLMRFQREISKNYDILDDYGKYQAKKYLKRTKINNNEIVAFLILIEYFKFQKELDKQEEQIVEELIEDTYKTEVEKISKETGRKKAKWFDWITFGIAIMLLPNSRGYVWKDYKDTIVRYNADEMYRTLLTSEDKKLYDLLQKQRNRMLKKKSIPTKEDKYIGALEEELVFIANKTKLKAYEDMGIEKALFLGVHDNKQTKMCESLNGQVFKLKGINKYYRYSDTAQGIIQFTTDGMIVGENLPPINDNFHYCRSTITYQI